MRRSISIPSASTPHLPKTALPKKHESTTSRFYQTTGAGNSGAHGLLLDGPHLLARAVMVVDKNNIIRYLQITPDLANMPDMEAAFAAARALL